MPTTTIHFRDPIQPEASHGARTIAGLSGLSAGDSVTVHTLNSKFCRVGDISAPGAAHGDCNFSEGNSDAARDPLSARQLSAAQRITAFLATGGRVLWSRDAAREREIERVAAVGRELVVAFVDGGEEVCGLWDSHRTGFALRWVPNRERVT